MTHPGLALTRPYPFTRLAALFKGVTPPAGLRPISLGIGEPRHATPACIHEAITASLEGLAHYPTMSGCLKLRETIARWCEMRYGAPIDPTREVLPVLGTREALFSFAQSVIDAQKNGYVLMPSPFYQIYEGAALLGGATPVYLPITMDNHYRMDFSMVSEDILKKTQLVFVCSPSNPTGSVLTLAEWKEIFELSDRYGFVVASDECYSEIYFDEANPPLGALTAARTLGRTDYKNLIVFNSLSKRSNAPGLRSGFVAGDARLIAPFLLYRTYHGSSMSPMIQAASIAAWSDEAHVRVNRDLYREKFAAAQPIINSVLTSPMPEASFYLWARTPGNDETFARDLYAATGVTVLPGSYLARDSFGINAGNGYVRMALVATPDEVREAAARIESFCKNQ